MNIKIPHKFPVLTTDRLILREFNYNDSHEYYKIRSNADIMKYMDSESFKTETQATESIKYMNDSFNKQSGIFWAINKKDNTELMGYVCYVKLIKDNFRGEIAYALLPEHWGNGYATEATKAIIEFGFENMNLHSIEADINPSNDSSKKLLAKLKFKQEALFTENYYYNGKFIDSAIYSLVKGW